MQTIADDIVTFHAPAKVSSSPPRHVSIERRLSSFCRRNNSIKTEASSFDGEDNSAKNDIRVLSPSKVNSQVLPKTRPLSPGCSPGAFTPDEATERRRIRLLQKETVEVPQQQGSSSTTSSGEDKTGCKAGRGRGKRRPRLFKLKFHHQALPQEYLDHYEATLRREQQTFPSKNVAEIALENPFFSSGVKETLSPLPPEAPKLRQKSKTQRNSRPITIHEAGSGTTEALIRDLLMARPDLKQSAIRQAMIARAQSVPSVMLASQGQTPKASIKAASSLQSPNCHIVDKQFTLSADSRHSTKKTAFSDTAGGRLGAAGLGVPYSRQEGKVYQKQEFYDQPDFRLPTVQPQSPEGNRGLSLVQNEPLNLCIRDLSSIMYGQKNACCDIANRLPKVKVEPMQVYESENFRSPSINSHDGDLFDYTNKNGIRTPFSPPSEYPLWGTSVPPHWIHDYRLKTEDGLSSGQSTPSICSQSSHFPPGSPPLWMHLSSPPLLNSPLSPTPSSPMSPSPGAKQLHILLKESLGSKTDEFIDHAPNNFSKLTPHNINNKSGGTRRKRSALFIPPADPSTEVSICKFKFTGGPNPVLEEKKMVSVDATGKLRYFSGSEKHTPKERLAMGQDKINNKLPEGLTKCEKDVKKIRLESEADDACSSPLNRLEPLVNGNMSSSLVDHLHNFQDSLESSPSEDSPKRKRRSKKSSVREKLEQTLREKGILIQTQQIQSAEGATYCKFRQLRKITRYLFRSWRDYLPGQLQETGPDPIDVVHIAKERIPQGCHFQQYQE